MTIPLWIRGMSPDPQNQINKSHLKMKEPLLARIMKIFLGV